MRHDWQAYLDGSLDPASQRAHEEALQSSPEAAAELRALQALRKAVKEAVTVSVQVPAQARRPFRLVPWAVAAVALLAVGVALYPKPDPPLPPAPDPMKFNTTAVFAKSPRTADLATSLAWLRQQAGYDLPVLELGSGAKFTGAEFGSDWACIRFERDGSKFQLFVRKDAPQLKLGEPGKLDCEGEFYMGRGIGWEADGLSYYLTADRSRNLKPMAVHIAPQTSQP